MPSFTYRPKRWITPQHKRYWEAGQDVTLQTDNVTNFLAQPDADKRVNTTQGGRKKVITRSMSLLVDVTITDIDEICEAPVWREFFQSTMCGERFTVDFCDLAFYAPVDVSQAFFDESAPEWNRLNSHKLSVSFTVCFDRLRTI